MNRPPEQPGPQWSRREVVATAAAASLLGGAALPAAEAATRAPTGEQPNRHRLAGIDPGNFVDEVQRRDLDAVSDADLCRQAAAIISRPPKKGGSSFSLHAPLELL